MNIVRGERQGHISFHIILITVLTTLVIKITTKNMAGVTFQDCIHPNSISAVLVLAFEVSVNIGIIKWLKFAIRTLRTFLFFFLSQ